MQADVLIVTVTKVESQAIVEVFQKATGQAPKNVPIGDKIYRNLGTINSATIFMVRSEMGAGGLGAAQQTVTKGIEALSPSAVIMAGIAFGVDAEKQDIGDVLVSKQLMLYDTQRVGTDSAGKPKIIPRGDRATASPWLIDRFRVADEDWDDSKGKVQFGLIVSGEKLVDNLEFRKQVRELEPEAIGGEMEGAGLYSASQSNKVDWILAKGICDWADGNKEENRDERQRVAAQNAANFVLHVLQHAPLKRIGANAREVHLALSEPHLSEAIRTTKPAFRSTLPSQPYFFGREKELATIADALSPESRGWGALIDGPGGIGKTALAIRAGHLACEDQYRIKIFLSAKKRELTPAGEQTLEDFLLPNYLDLLSELARELGEDEITRIPPTERANAVRRALADKDALLVIDNVETFQEQERIRLYQFLDRLPGRCKAIVTSRRRANIAANVIRLDRLGLKEAMDLIEELAKFNKFLAKASATERQELYEIAHGNPLLIKWVVGQLGRSASQCRTVLDACDFLKSAPKGNDPLEYIFGDLLDTFTTSETAVLAALVHFRQPAKVEWIAKLAQLAGPATQTALEDLSDRALLVGDEQSETFLLPTLAATFLRRTRPEAVVSSGNRLVRHAYALAMEHGGRNFKGYPHLESEWPAIAAALPIFLQEENKLLQEICDGLTDFLDFSGRWDEWLSITLVAEEKALAALDFFNAGWRAYYAGWVYYLRRQAAETLNWSNRCEAHWKKAGGHNRESAYAIRLRGDAYVLQEKFPAALACYEEALSLDRSGELESVDVGMDLIRISHVKLATENLDEAERYGREALRIAKKRNDKEGVANYTESLATIALAREDWIAGENLARKALHLAENVTRVELIGSACIRLARALTGQGRSEEGRPYAQRALSIYQKLRLPSGVSDAQRALKECQTLSSQ